MLDCRNKQGQNDGVFGMWTISEQTQLTQQLFVFQQLDSVIRGEAGEITGQFEALPKRHVHVPVLGHRDGAGTLV